jgi:heptosyltransferase II
VVYKIDSRPWSKSSSPRKILVIRLQALGDAVITLPYLNSLKEQYPLLSIDFFTRKEICSIPTHLSIFDNVIALGGGRNAKLQFILALLKLPLIWIRNYDVIIDLQNNRVSRILRLLSFVQCWSAFDRFSPRSAGERVQLTIAAAGFDRVQLKTSFDIRCPMPLQLYKEGYQDGDPIVVLNPAGYCSSRNWPLSSYIAFATSWLLEVNRKTKFVLLLLPSLRHKADTLKNALGKSCIDLTGKTNQIEAFRIVQRATLMLSEDSGLMHMAWVQGVPTVALFSSSRKDWSAPQGTWSVCLNSSDLPCGPCGKEVCIFGDNHCLTRYTPQQVIAEAQKLIPALCA